LTLPEGLAAQIEGYYSLPAQALGNEARAAFDAFLAALESGEVRAAEPTPDGWRVNAWVKKGILLGFRMGRVVALEAAGPLRFLDKDTLPARRFTTEDGVRLVPGGSAVRAGAHLESGVVIMPPAYVNVGAYVGEGSLIDSRANGLPARLPARPPLAGAMLGGVLEPVGALPVIVGTGVLIIHGVYEGAVLGRHAVLGPGSSSRQRHGYDPCERRAPPRGGVALHPPGRRRRARLPWGAGLVRGAPRPEPVRSVIVGTRRPTRRQHSRRCAREPVRQPPRRAYRIVRRVDMSGRRDPCQELERSPPSWRSRNTISAGSTA
jgi:2,3,4,5-tetrahydropyridine-2-carboxylate N-succinyltransferase